MSKKELELPKLDYYLDESDPDKVILRRQDDAFVAAFSARGYTKERIIEAAKEDHRELVRAYVARQGHATKRQGSHQSA